MYFYVFFIKMKSKRFIFEKANEGQNPKEIQIFLNEQFDKEVNSKTNVYKQIAQTKLGFDFGNETEPPGQKSDEKLCIRILEVLEDKPFSLFRSIASYLNEDISTIYRYLNKCFHRVYRSSKRIPHQIDLQQKKNRVAQIKTLLKIIQTSKHEYFRNIVTGDQKWFNLYYGSGGAWIIFGQNPP